MTVKASISLTDRQDAFARGLVEAGRHPSLSALPQRGLDLPRDETEARGAETAALRTLLEERAKGQFLDAEAAQAQTARMLEIRRSQLGPAD